MLPATSAARSIGMVRIVERAPVDPCHSVGSEPGAHRVSLSAPAGPMSVYGVQIMRSCIPLFNVTVVGGGPVTSK
jgi:hypothetical protein